MSNSIFPFLPKTGFRLFYAMPVRIVNARTCGRGGKNLQIQLSQAFTKWEKTTVKFFKVLLPKMIIHGMGSEIHTMIDVKNIKQSLWDQ